MVNHIPQHQSLVILAEKEPHDLAVELARYQCTRISISGTPANLKAISDYPNIEDVSLSRCAVSDLSALGGLSRLRRLSVGFGQLANLDLSFCASTLDMLSLSYLRRLKDLSTIPFMPKLEHLTIQHIHSFVPPDFQLLPNLRHLSIWNTDWLSLEWLSHLPQLETLHISQAKVEDNNWKPITHLQHLRHLHGMRSVFRSTACKEFIQLRPDVRVDQGIPVDLEKHPQTKALLEELSQKRKELGK